MKSGLYSIYNYTETRSSGCTVVINNYPLSISSLSSPFGMPSFSCFKLTVISYLGNMIPILLRYSPQPNEEWLHLMERALLTQNYYWFWYYFMVISILSCGLCLPPLTFSFYFRYLLRVTLLVPVVMAVWFSLSHLVNRIHWRFDENILTGQMFGRKSNKS